MTMNSDIKLISGRVKKTPAGETPQDRYEFIKLNDVEPDLGVPIADNSIPASLVDGTRKWLVPAQGISVSSSNEIFVNENNVPIDTENLSFSDSNTLTGVFSDLDDVLLNVEGLVATFISTVATDETISGDGSEEDPLSVNYGSVNIETRNENAINVNLTNFLSICFRIDDAFRDSGAKAFNRSDEQIILI